MANEDYITRSEVQAMIENALRSWGVSHFGGGVSGSGRTAAEINSVALRHKMEAEQRARPAPLNEKKPPVPVKQMDSIGGAPTPGARPTPVPTPPPTPPPTATPPTPPTAPPPTPVPTPVPAPTPTPTVVPATDDIAEQRKQDKAADEAKTVSPATINEAIINEAIAQILTAMKANNCASQAWVMSQIRAAVPEPIRTMGAQARTYYGDYLKLEPATPGANVIRTAVWGKLDVAEGEGKGDDLPSNANKSKWMVLTMSADNATAVDNPDLWSVDWVRAHA